MMRKKTLRIAAVVLAVLLLAGVTAYAAVNYGSKDDPLITKSYLDEVMKPQLENELQTKLDAAAADVLRSTPGEFALVELKAGQTLRCAAGCQILPVRGSVSAVGSFADTTAGEAVSAEAALQANHLYLATEEGGVLADAAAAVLVSGSYLLD